MRTTSTIGHTVSLRLLRSDLHLLMAVYLASQPIAAIADFDVKRDVSVYKVEDCELESITRLIVSTSINIRVLDDQEENKLDMLSLYCGTLTNDVEKPLSTQGLTLREACNKVIHAITVDFDHGRLETGGTFLHPFLYLRGRDQRQRTWEANLDVVQFVRESLNAIAYLKSKIRAA